MNIKNVLVTAALLAGGTLHAGPAAPLLAQAPMNTGIKVHGDWTIEVQQPDGRLVSRREIKNSLAAEGRAFLASMLARGSLLTDRHWMVWFVPPEGGPAAPCADGVCLVIEPESIWQPYDTGGRNLRVELLDNAVVLTGSFTADRSGKITTVSTATVKCVAIFGDCGSETDDQGGNCQPVPFSGTTLLAPIQIEPGQIVQVKVVVSFS
jgi:hypothetical protein